ncbi:MAG: hypothetical protein A3H43_02885 [Gammaproteobacteria bacterium RIFCSPLOWO2_02_FULL_42_9]|nr:MAG: hypothetical protein A3H43_02885 [Gammaproteobacteria bacterium RIFCSPLOWO2_02_FULL_42_9]
MATLQFKGKSAVWNHHLSVPYHTLEKDAKKSLKGVDVEENLIIEGDNLLALKSLLPKYQGQIKCIYIDPPYNTGNEKWVYSDNVNSPTIKEWFDNVVGKEGEDLTRHDKWLCMMTPRLKLLRDLLASDGVIFISIDENEIYNLRSLMNEIFGPQNFIAELPTIMNLKGNQDEFGFAGTHEYTIVWAKQRDENLHLNEFDIDEEEMEKWEEDEIGYFKRGANLKATGVNAPREKRPNLFFSIYVTKNDEILLEKRNKGDAELLPIDDNKEMSWRWSKDKISREPYNLIVARDGDDVTVYKKQRPSLGDIPSKKPKSIFYKPEYSSGNGTAQLKSIFGKKIFDNPKPVDLILDFLKIGSNKDSIVLDSFAGSGTTAHAVLDLNSEDEGKRKFVLVQLPEKIEEDRPAYEAGFRWVHEITRERVKRVIAKNKYKTGFTYYTLGSSIDAESILMGKLPTYKEFAKYVYYLATGKNHPDEKKIKEEYSFVGKTDHQSVYLVYEKNADALKKLAITLDWAQKTHKKDSNKKIVYAPACYLDDEALEQFNIKFVSIPYNLFERQ